MYRHMALVKIAIQLNNAPIYRYVARNELTIVIVTTKHFFQSEFFTPAILYETLLYLIVIMQLTVIFQKFSNRKTATIIQYSTSFQLEAKTACFE